MANWGGMGKQQFDERYPTMFQPGGESVPDHLQWPVQPGSGPGMDHGHAVSLPPAVPAALQPAHHGSPDGSVHSGWAPGLPAADSESATEAVIGAAAHDMESGGQAAAAPAAWPTPAWWVPAAVGTFLFAAGLVIVGIPVMMSGSTDDPNSMNMAQMWVYTAGQVASPLIGAGLGALAAVLFLNIRVRPKRAEGLRRLFAIATAAVLFAGFYAQFAMFLLQPVPEQSYDSFSGQSYTVINTPAVATALSMVAFGPLLVGFLMLAALSAVRRPSRLRAYLVGLSFLGAAAVAQFAPQIFPDIPPTTQYFEGGNQAVAAWPFWLPGLAPSLLAAGALVLAVTALFPALAAAVRMPVPAPVGEPPAVAPGRPEPVTPDSTAPADHDQEDPDAQPQL